MASRSKKKPRKPKPARQPTDVWNLFLTFLTATAANIVGDVIWELIQHYFFNRE